MRELIIGIFASGPNTQEENARAIIKSVDENIGIEDYGYYVYVGTQKMSNVYKEVISPRNLHKISISSEGYAQQYNRIVNECKDKYRYMIYSHDDVIVDTPNFYVKTIDTLKNYLDKIGWITYTNHSYTSGGILLSNTLRAGIHKDRTKYPRIFECHTNDLKKLDYPNGPVDVFGPMSHFNLVSLKAMQKIGPCVDWSSTPLLTDEDWALASCVKGLINVWIPNIFYKHPRPGSGAKRVKDSLRFRTKSHQEFRKKWGGDIPYSESHIKSLVHRFPMLRKFMGFTYEWRYL